MTLLSLSLSLSFFSSAILLSLLPTFRSQIHARAQRTSRVRPRILKSAQHFRQRSFIVTLALGGSHRRARGNWRIFNKRQAQVVVESATTLIALAGSHSSILEKNRAHRLIGRTTSRFSWCRESRRWSEWQHRRTTPSGIIMRGDPTPTHCAVCRRCQSMVTCD